MTVKLGLDFIRRKKCGIKISVSTFHLDPKNVKTTMSHTQGDQIGRFAQSTIVYFGQYLKKYRNSPQFCASLYQSIGDVF
jgi:hypothetical protein